MKNAYTKILIAAMFFQSHFVGQFALGQTVNDANRAVQTYVEPNENCQQTQGLQADEYGRSYDLAYQQCLGRNRKKDELRNYMNRGANDAEAISSGRPDAPKNTCVNNGGSGADGGYDYSYQNCMSNYQSKLREHERRIDAYNKSQAEQEKAKAQLAAEAQSEENKRIAKLNNTTATGSAAESQQMNQQGQQAYLLAGLGLAALAVKNFTGGQSCAASCPWGCCPAAGGLFAAGAAYMLLNAKANKQATENYEAAKASCIVNKQLSNSDLDCDKLVTKPSPPPVTELYEPDGSCKKSAPPGCSPATGGPGTSGPNTTRIPTNCVDKATGKSISCLTDGLKGLVQNPDGSVRVKDKNYTDKDFADKKSMMALGMSEAAADQLMKDLYGSSSPLTKAGLDAKGLAAIDQGKGFSDKNKFGEFGSGGGGTAVIGTGNGSGSSGKFSDRGVGGAGGGADRGLASDGLTRDFNGDLIGAAGDDIFTMMNRRYKLKAEQDAFIDP